MTLVTSMTARGEATEEKAKGGTVLHFPSDGETRPPKRGGAPQADPTVMHHPSTIPVSPGVVNPTADGVPHKPGKPRKRGKR